MIANIILLWCFAYSVSRLINYMTAANNLSVEKKRIEESEARRKRKLDELYGRNRD